MYMSVGTWVSVLPSISTFFILHFGAVLIVLYFPHFGAVLTVLYFTHFTKLTLINSYYHFTKLKLINNQITNNMFEYPIKTDRKKSIDCQSVTYKKINYPFIKIYHILMVFKGASCHHRSTGY